MKTAIKIILAVSVLFLVIIIFAGGTAFYFYFHPSSVKALIERSVSKATGEEFKIEGLSYSINPFTVRANGIYLNQTTGREGREFRIKDLFLEFEFEGPFGNRTLKFKRIRVEKLSSFILIKKNLQRDKNGDIGSSKLYSLFRDIVSTILFRDIKFGAVEVLESAFGVKFEDNKVLIKGINVFLDPDSGLDIFCEVIFENAQYRIFSKAKNVRVTSENFKTLNSSNMEGLISVEWDYFSIRDAEIQGMHLLTSYKYHHKRGLLNFKNLTIITKKIFLNDKSKTISSVFNAYLKADAKINLVQRLIHIPSFCLESENAFLLKGKASLKANPKHSFDIALYESHFAPGKILDLLPEKIRSTRKFLDFEGRIDILGEIRAVKDSGSWGLDCRVVSGFVRNRFSFKSRNLSAEGFFSGTLKAEGNLQKLEAEFLINGENILLSTNAFDVKPLKMKFTTKITYPELIFKGLSIRIPKAEIFCNKRKLDIDNIELSLGQGRLDKKKSTVSAQNVRLESSLLRNLEASLDFKREKAYFKVYGKQTNFIATCQAFGLIPFDWKFSGEDEIGLEAEFDERKELSFGAKIAFNRIAFEDKGGNFAGEELAGKTVLVGKINSDRSRITAKTTFEVKKGELLYDRFYLDLLKNSLSSSANISYDTTERTVRLENLELGFKDILELDVNGVMINKKKSPELNLNFSISKSSLKPAFRHFIQEPFQTEKPLLAEIEIDGDYSAALNLKITDNTWGLKGHWFIDEGSLGTSRGISLKGINLDLPLRLSTQNGKGGDDIVKGSISIGSINLPMCPDQDLSVELIAEVNSLSVDAPVKFKTQGGDVIIGPTEIKYFSHSTPSVSTSLTLNIVDINTLLPKIWPDPIHGSVKGTLYPVQLKNESIVTGGEVKTEVFDGDIILSNIGVTGLFTSAPLISLNAKLDHLNMEKITKGTSFGKIEGVLTGQINDLEIVYGQPQKFDLLIETVRQEGISQQISVKAVDNIAQIGGGSSPFLGLAGAFSSLLKDFPYEKIGIHASLENDIFRVNGTVHEGGKEYLVKRGGFSGVNIINQNPDNKIRFKDMIKRVKRVTAGGEGPVIR